MSNAFDFQRTMRDRRAAPCHVAAAGTFGRWEPVLRLSFRPVDSDEVSVVAGTVAFWLESSSYRLLYWHRAGRPRATGATARVRSRFDAQWVVDMGPTQCGQRKR